MLLPAPELFKKSAGIFRQVFFLSSPFGCKIFAPNACHGLLKGSFVVLKCGLVAEHFKITGKDRNSDFLRCGKCTGT